MRAFLNFILVLSANHDLVELYTYWVWTGAAGVFAVDGAETPGSRATAAPAGGIRTGRGGPPLYGTAGHLPAGAYRWDGKRRGIADGRICYGQRPGILTTAYG